MPDEPTSSSSLPPPASPSDLPAPWQNPWGVLARDLAAALASLRLKARELIRRNREGEFATPPFWPPALRSLFWPLLLTTTVLLPVLVAGLLLRPYAPPAPLVPPAPAAPATVPSLPSTAAPPSQQAPEPWITPPPGPPPQGSLAAELDPSPPGLASKSSGEASPAAPEADPLLLALQQAGGETLLTALQRRPEQAALDLALSANWSSLAAERRQRLAEDWLELVRNEGWETLLLVDGQGGELGRPAAVGSGMILLDPSAH